MLLRLFDREGLRLIPMVEFASPLPELEAVCRAGGPGRKGWNGSVPTAHPFGLVAAAAGAARLLQPAPSARAGSDAPRAARAGVALRRPPVVGRPGRAALGRRLRAVARPGVGTRRRHHGPVRGARQICGCPPRAPSASPSAR